MNMNIHDTKHGLKMSLNSLLDKKELQFDEDNVYPVCLLEVRVNIISNSVRNQHSGCIYIEAKERYTNSFFTEALWLQGAYDFIPKHLMQQPTYKNISKYWYFNNNISQRVWFRYLKRLMLPNFFWWRAELDMSPGANNSAKREALQGAILVSVSVSVIRFLVLIIAGHLLSS